MRNHPGAFGDVVFNNESIDPLVPFLGSEENVFKRATRVINNCKEESWILF